MTVLFTLLLVFASLHDAQASSAMSSLSSRLAADLPLQIQSEKRGDALFVIISATLTHPYSQVTRVLRSGHNLCEIAPLHFNIKACTHQVVTSEVLTFFSGRKHYQTPENASPYRFQYEVSLYEENQFEARLLPQADARRYMPEPVLFRARPLGANQTHVQVRFSYRDSVWMRMATEGYFATLGRGKTGFSIAGKDATGRPVLVDGVEGAIERNAVRYYFALDAFLATHPIPEPRRFESRLNHWFDLTERFPAQLHEMDKKTYIGNKRREREEQRRLQGALTRAAFDG